MTWETRKDTVWPGEPVKMRPMLCAGPHPKGGVCRKILCLTSLRVVDEEHALVAKECGRCHHMLYLG